LVLKKQKAHLREIKNRKVFKKLKRIIFQDKNLFLKSELIMFGKKFTIIYSVYLLLTLVPCQSQDSKPIFTTLYRFM
jgi:hypothetical protein